MGGRYLVTGSQLGVLIASKSCEERKRVVDEIIEKQFLGHTTHTSIEKDVDSILRCRDCPLCSSLFDLWDNEEDAHWGEK